MEKANPKAREYRFFSQKNQKMVCLHSEQALAYARHLEDRLWVAAYNACVPLELTDQIDPWASGRSTSKRPGFQIFAWSTQTENRLFGSWCGWKTWKSRR